MPKQIRRHTAAAAALLLLLMGPCRAMAKSRSALDAYQELVRSQSQEDPAFSAADLLEQIIAGKYEADPADAQASAEIAQDLDPLCGITNKDLAAYATMNSLSLIQVRNAYYTAQPDPSWLPQRGAGRRFRRQDPALASGIPASKRSSCDRSLYHSGCLENEG